MFAHGGSLVEWEWDAEDDWVMNAAGRTGLAPRGFNTPSATVTGKGTAYLTDGRRMRRVTVQEAAVLQSFPPDHPWRGSKTKQYEQVGNAIPPVLAGHIIRAAAPALVSPEQAETDNAA